MRQRLYYDTRLLTPYVSLSVLLVTYCNAVNAVPHATAPLVRLTGTGTW